MRLSNATWQQLPTRVARPGYARDEQQVGIVHLGIGAFHRAHQAWYTDRCMDAGDRHWAIAGVSMRSGKVAAQLNPQDGLYTVTERSADAEHCRLLGSLREVLVAPLQRDAVTARLAAPGTHVVSLTITERGYCRKPDGSLDSEQASSNSAFAVLAAGLRARCDAGLAGLTLLSCDNLAHNGRQLARLMAEYLERHDPLLLPWFQADCACPSTMVDRVVPAPTDDDRFAVASRLGLSDEGAVLTEPFCQWAIEDRFAGPRPRWERVGALLVPDIAAHEDAKLRLLNAAHSALAYLGLAHGHSYVHEAVANAEIRRVVEGLLAEAATTLASAAVQAARTYRRALLDRFANPSLRHRLSQIAIDGSQKLPQRWLQTLALRQGAGQASPAICAAIAGWLHHLLGANGPVDDPRADELARACRAAGRSEMFIALFGVNGPMASAWHPGDADKTVVMRAFDGLQALLAHRSCHA
ncbi:mannitol dehydrogenase family protein [Roseateles sp. NT4]|uniref:mannitol dehydrogenase family protein n=1 Tax=Roseateles sp. NT4 TaxID=3453715 RepID=UPI003EEDF809